MCGVVDWVELSEMCLLMLMLFHVLFYFKLVRFIHHHLVLSHTHLYYSITLCMAIKKEVCVFNIRLCTPHAAHFTAPVLLLWAHGLTECLKIFMIVYITSFMISAFCCLKIIKKKSWLTLECGSLMITDFQLSFAMINSCDW